jgi:hypothetical protein
MNYRPLQEDYSVLFEYEEWMVCVGVMFQSRAGMFRV